MDIETIQGAAHIGNIGDEKIFAMSIEQVIRVHNGVMGADAL
jgi:nitrogen regulatory protein PII